MFAMRRSINRLSLGDEMMQKTVETKACMSNDLAQALLALGKRIVQLTDKSEQQVTAIPALSLFRSNEPSEPIRILYEPSICLITQGAKRVLLPMASASDIPTVPAEIFSKFQISFYADPVDAVYKALGVE